MPCSYKTENTRIEALIKVEQDAYDIVAAEHKKVKEELEKLRKANPAGSTGTSFIATAASCLVGSDVTACGTMGNMHAVAAVEGELYANVGNIYSCTFGWSGETWATEGVAMAASATGKLSAVACATPKLTVAQVAKVAQSTAKNKFAATLVIKEGATEIKFTGNSGKNTVTFVTESPELQVGPPAEVTIYGTSLTGGKTFVPNFMIKITDADTASDLLVKGFKASGMNSQIISSIALQAVVGQAGMYQLAIKGPGKVGTMSIKCVVADPNGNQVSFSFKLVSAALPNVLIKLSTHRGNKVRGWHDTDFWCPGDESEVEGASSKSHKNFGKDIRTVTYFQPVGKRLDIEHYRDSKTTIYAAASYDISSTYQKISLKELLCNPKYQKKSIGKKNKARSRGKKSYYGSMLSTNCGGCCPRKGDPFIDDRSGDQLVVQGEKTYNSRIDKQRLINNYNGCRGGHIYGGIGGTHEHNGWGIDYEGMPVVGYCNTHHGYGQLSHGWSAGNGQSRTPYKDCGGSKTRYNIDVSITRGN